MTIVVAARKHGKVVIGGDNLTTFGDVKLVRMKNAGKLFRFRHFVVGMSGTGPLPQVLERMRDSTPADPEQFEEAAAEVEWNETKIESTGDCSKFLSKFMEIYQEIGNTEDVEGIGLLVATPKTIFCTLGEANVFEVDDFWAVGSGAPYSIGHMDSVFESIRDSNELAKRVSESIETACRYCSGCEPPVEIFNVCDLTDQ